MIKLNKKIIFGIIFILLQLILLTNIVNASWWNPNWIFKQEINLTATTATAQNYTINIILNSSNVGTGFNWNNECSNNKTRIRFIDNNDLDELPFFVEKCSQINQNMSIWLKVEDSILTSGTNVYLYYGNSGGTLISDPENSFDFYLNYSTLTMASEESGSSQDISGNGDILENGRSFHTWGNSWKVFNGFNSYTMQNSGTQILEINMKSNDCGEIIGTEFDTDTVQSGARSYRWCGTQTNWGTVPDKQYTSSGNWQTVYTILNDFTITPTHIHLPIDDDADASGDVYFKDFRIRKYQNPEPSFTLNSVEVINTTIQSLSPINNFSTNENSITFTCHAATTNTTSLKNISLYGNWNGGWHLEDTKILSGQIDSETFTVTFTENFASYNWNCLVYDNDGFSDWYDVNYTINIDKVAPQITINNPTTITQDFTPLLDINFDENVNAWYNINSSSNISLCNNCITSIDTGLYLEEGNYILNVFANDSQGNLNSTSKIFTINMNKKYIENFNDNFSINNLNGNNLGNGNLTFTGNTKMYNGIEIGYVSTNIQFFANQWGGSGNAGEIDITCLGGDSNCYFKKQNGTIISTPTIINGVTTTDSVSGVVGFIMYSATDIHTRWSGMHAQQSNHYVSVCYNSGQWYYDDNNAGCTKAFTPVSTDILVANLTWGITSVSGIQTNLAAGSNVLIKQLNLSHNITEIKNITWNSFNTNSNNNVTINISLDEGTTWHNTTNGIGISNITQNNKLLIKIIFNSDASLNPGIYNFSIYWDNIIKQKPLVNIINPINNSKILGNQINLTWNIVDNQENLNCSIFIDSTFNQTINCSSLTTNNRLYNLSKGYHQIYIKVNDSENYSIDSSSYNFYIIKNYLAINEKKISYENTNMYKIKIIGENIIEYVTNLFTSGSFSPIFNWNNVSSKGEIIGWDSSIQNINYSISGNNYYKMQKNYVIGID